LGGRLVIRLAQFLLDWFSQFVAMISVNRVSFHSDSNNEKVCKRRIAGDWILVVLSRGVFRCRRVPVSVLLRHAWVQRVRSIKAKIRGEEVCVRGQGILGVELITEKIPGEPLASILCQDDPFSRKQQLLVVAAKALRTFHKHELNVRGVGDCLLSHGDASIMNVIYDERLEIATWFDFDLAHDDQFAAEKRYADDLRSLLFSSAHLFNLDSIEPWVRSMREAYPELIVWSELVDQLSSRWFPLDVFHLAQVKRARKNGCMSQRELRLIDLELVRAIKAVHASVEDSR
jgi:hypothetical protein